MEFLFYGGVAFFILKKVDCAIGGKLKRKHGAEAAQLMVLQIYTDYHLPIMPQDLTWEMMEYFYLPLRDNLMKIQRNANKEKK